MASSGRKAGESSSSSSSSSAALRGRCKENLPNLLNGKLGPFELSESDSDDDDDSGSEFSSSAEGDASGEPSARVSCLMAACVRSLDPLRCGVWGLGVLDMAPLMAASCPAGMVDEGVRERGARLGWLSE